MSHFFLSLTLKKKKKRQKQFFLRGSKNEGRKAARMLRAYKHPNTKTFLNAHFIHRVCERDRHGKGGVCLDVSKT